MSAKAKSQITTEIPAQLREIGVVRVTMERDGWDVRYLLDFADGDHLNYREPQFSWGESAKTEADLLQMVINAIYIYRTLPFN